MAGYDQSIYRMYLAEVPMFARCSTAQLDLVAHPRRGRLVRTRRRHRARGRRRRRLLRDHRRRAACTAAAIATSPSSEPATTSASSRSSIPHRATRPSPRPTPRTCVVLSPDAFRRALDEIPAVRDALLHGMARRIHELDERF